MPNSNLKFPDIVSRDRAKSLGILYYFTGITCAQGHNNFRYTSTRACKSCSALDNAKHRQQRRDNPVLAALDVERNKKKYWSNPEKFRAKSREFGAKNPPTREERDLDNARRKREYHANFDREKANRKKWLEKNKDKKAALDAKWQRDNPDRVKVTVKRWQEKNKDAVRSFTRNYRAKKKAAAGIHTGEDIKALFSSQNAICACGCGVSLIDGYDVDHIIPISRGGDNWPSNLQLLTPSCNKSKNDKTMDEWMAIRAATSSDANRKGSASL